MKKDLTPKGCTLDFEKFEKLRAEYWVRLDLGMYNCKRHNTMFDFEGIYGPDIQPCWQCHKECEKEL